MNKPLLCAVILTLPLLAAAQDVWRCGPDGRSYAQQPCPEGRRIETTDSRPASDVRAAQALAAREIRLAEVLHRERLRQEALQRGNGLASLGPQQDTGPVRSAQLARAKASASKSPQKSTQLAARGTSPSAAQGSRRTKG